MRRYPGFQKSDSPSEKVGKDLSIGPVPLASLWELGLIPNKFSFMVSDYDLGACAMRSLGVTNIL
jgi:hypothetical protein